MAKRTRSAVDGQFVKKTQAKKALPQEFRSILEKPDPISSLPDRFFGTPRLVEMCPVCLGRHFMTFGLNHRKIEYAICPKVGSAFWRLELQGIAGANIAWVVFP